MDTMVERVAKMLCDELNSVAFDELPDRAVMRPAMVFAAKTQARLAAERLIMVLREPTETMSSAGSDAGGCDAYSMEQNTETIWQAMIDAALSEDPPAAPALPA